MGTSIAFYAAMVDRAYYLDGVLFLWDVLTTKNAFYAPDHYRFSSYFFQFPAVIFARLNLDYASNLSFQLMYLILPYLFPFVLFKRNKEDGAQLLMVLYFYVVVVTALLFAVNYATDTGILGWSIMLVLLSGPLNTKKLSLCAVLLICLALSYETGILLFIPATIYLFLDRKNQTLLDYRMSLAVFLSIFAVKFGLNFETTLQLAGTPVVLGFKRSLMEAIPLDKSPFLYAYALISLGLFIPFSKIRWAVLTGLSLTYAYIVLTTPTIDLFNASHSFRSFVVPLAFGGMTLILFDRFSPFKIQIDKFSYLAVFLCITVSLVRDARGTIHWHQGKKIFLKKLEHSSGCQILEEKEANNGLYKHGIIDENVSKTSIMWQIGSPIKTVIHPGSRPYDYYKEVNFCDNYSEVEKLYIIQYRGGYFPDHVSFDSEYIQSRLKFEPKRRVFKVSELQNCDTTNILNFTPDETRILNDTSYSDFKLVIHGNDNEDIRFKVSIETSEKKTDLELSHLKTDRPISLKQGEVLKINKMEDRWFDDKYHPNRLFYAINCMVPNS